MRSLGSVIPPVDSRGFKASWLASLTPKVLSTPVTDSIDVGHVCRVGGERRLSFLHDVLRPDSESFRRRLLAHADAVVLSCSCRVQVPRISVIDPRTLYRRAAAQFAPNSKLNEVNCFGAKWLHYPRPQARLVNCDRQCPAHLPATAVDRGPIMRKKVSRKKKMEETMEDVAL